TLSLLRRARQVLGTDLNCPESKGASPKAQGPLWVKSGHKTVPLLMSALPPRKADITGQASPRPLCARTEYPAAPVDRLVGGGEELAASPLASTVLVRCESLRWLC